MQIVAIAGSLRAASFNQQLVRTAAAHAPPGAVVEVWQGLGQVPPLQRGHRPRSGAAAGGGATRGARRRGRGADRDSGVQRVAARAAEERAGLGVAALHRLRAAGKPVAVIGASASPRGARWAQAELRKVLGVIGADVLERTVPVGSAWAAFDPDGQLIDPTALRELQQLLTELHARTQRVPEPAAS